MSKKLLEGNLQFVEEIFTQAPDFFSALAKGQSPDVLWVGCADSRVPPEIITSSLPGEIFVHRNIANLVTPGDANFDAVLEYAVSHLGVGNIIVCGHYGCGGVAAADKGNVSGGALREWLSNIGEAVSRLDEKSSSLSPEARHNLLVEENVALQIEHLLESDIVKERVSTEKIVLHGWVYDHFTGFIKSIVTVPETHPESS